MPKQEVGLDQVFQALADPTRRKVIERLVSGPASTSVLAEPFDMALPSFTQHLAVLERAGLVQSARESRLIRYRADFGGMARLLAFLMQDCCQGAPEMCGHLMAGLACEPGTSG